MALNVCNWSDKQLDELVDMLKSADFSAVATFVANNFLCSGSRIMTDSTDSTLRATIGTDPQTVVLSKGVFVHGGKCSQLDGDQIVNITGGAAGNWGDAGQAADVTNPRWDVICIKNNVQAHTAEDRWFVDDSVSPNTYSLQSTNTYINKAYYDIKVVHGNAEAVPIVPDATTDYWTIVEVYVPQSGSPIVPYDTTQISLHTPVNWDGNTRVLRMEFWSTKFSVDHDPLTGHHRPGGWYIGSTAVTTDATELNIALDGINVSTVTAANLTKLTNGSRLSSTELHMHGWSQQYIWIVDEKPSGTDGGTFTFGAWRTRTLNTTKWDDTGAVVLAGNRITLPAGTYVCLIFAPCKDGFLHKARLRNITDGVTTLVGSSEEAMISFVFEGSKYEVATQSTTRSIIQGKFTIAVPTVFEIQHYCSSTRTNVGFGGACNFGEKEVYTIAEFWKVA